MRVIAGNAKHLKLLAPPGKETRPTADSIRETLFNMLRNEINGAVFLDLYAGSGAIGIEALSRGAKKAYFFENAVSPLKCLLQNLQTTGFSGQAKVFRSDVLTSLARVREEAVDIIYLDPPYEAGLYLPTLEALSAMPYVTPYTTVIAECGVREDLSKAGKAGFTVIREKCYKHNKHLFLQLTGEGA